jgi:hypothetical protein
LPSFSFLPSQPKFFELFERASTNLLDGARLLQDLFDDYTDVESKVAKITEVEHQGDQVVHEVTGLASTSLIAPIDNEDSQHLIFAIDDALDAIEGTAWRLVLYQVEQPTPIARQLAECIFRSAEELNKAMPALRSRKLLEGINSHVIKINEMENEADDLMRQGITQLVAHRDDMFNLIRWKEIYEHLEATTDRLEDVGDVLLRIMIKNA